MGNIERDEHRIVVLQCDECGEPRAGCRAVECALTSRPYAGEDVVPVDQLREAVHRGDWFRQAWANAQGCSVEEAERAFETLGDITTNRGK